MRRGVVLLVVVAFLAVTALWWLFIVGPRNSSAASVEAELDAARQRESTLRQQIASLQSIKDQEVSYVFAIGQMESAIPEFPEADSFLEQLNFLAHRTGVTVSSVALATPAADPAAEGGPLEIAINLAASGEYFEVLGFLYGLEAMERLVRVDAITLSPGADPGDVPDEGPEEENDDQDLTQGPRPRPEITNLNVTISGALFTRTPVAVEVGEDVPPESGGEDEPPPEGGGE